MLYVTLEYLVTNRSWRKAWSNRLASQIKTGRLVDRKARIPMDLVLESLGMPLSIHALGGVDPGLVQDMPGVIATYSFAQFGISLPSGVQPENLLRWSKVLARQLELLQKRAESCKKVPEPVRSAGCQLCLLEARQLPQRSPERAAALILAAALADEPMEGGVLAAALTQRLYVDDYEAYTGDRVMDVAVLRDKISKVQSALLANCLAPFGVTYDHTSPS